MYAIRSYYGLVILRQVAGEYLADLEIIGQLKAQHGVVELLVTDLLNVLLRAQAIGVLVVVGDAAAGDDGFEVELAAQLLAGIVQPAPQAHAAVIRMNEHIRNNFV